MGVASPGRCELLVAAVAFRVRCAAFVKRKLFMTMHSIRHFRAFFAS